MKKSQNTFQLWIAAGLEQTSPPPSSRPVDVCVVKPMQKFEALIGGYQNSGSGGYSAAAEWAGVEPRIIGKARVDSDSSTTKTFATLVFPHSVGVLYVFAYDIIDSPIRVRTSTLFICAGNKDVAAAIPYVESLRRQIQEKAESRVNMPYWKQHVLRHFTGTCVFDGHRYREAASLAVSAVDQFFIQCFTSNPPHMYTSTIKELAQANSKNDNFAVAIKLLKTMGCNAKEPSRSSWTEVNWLKIQVAWHLGWRPATDTKAPIAWKVQHRKNVAFDVEQEEAPFDPSCQW